MAINIKFDSTGNPEPPTIILAKRNGDKLGQLRVEPESIELNDKFNDVSEISFTLNKYIDGKITNLWNDVVDFKLVHCKEWDMWFEITVELDEETETVKTVFCKQLGQAELSQINLYDMHINEEGDSNWNPENGTYKNTILFNPEDTETSLLHRLLKDKAPHYSIEYVDSTIANEQRTFSFDGTSIYDAFMEIAEEIGCLFVFHSNSDSEGKIQRTISVHDLQQNCLNEDCKHRGEFTDVCPKCGSTNIEYGYGEDTTIFVTSDELASGDIQLTTDTDSVKNCFKLEAGDDLMTATIRNCNPNGTDYIWYFSDDMKSDMSEELVAALSDYDNKYKDYYDNYVSDIDISAYNVLVEKYAEKYNANSVHCLSCGHKGDFESVCPECGSNNLLVGDRLKPIDDTIVGYPALMNAYYDVIDLGLYLESGLMPSIEISDDLKAEDYAAMLTREALSPVAVNTKEADDISKTTADSAVLSMAKIIVKSTYEVKINESTYSNNVWTGNFKITNYSSNDDDEDKDEAISSTISIDVNNDTETFIKQKIEKALNKEDTENVSISGLFASDYNEFCEQLKNYALIPLKSFYDACDACLTILIDQGAGNQETNPDLYENLYMPYLEKGTAIANEIKIREDEVNSICGVWDETDKENPKLTTKGLQQHIEACRNEIQDALDFQKYLEGGNKSNKNLWLEFCTYRREDKYSNDNYISDGLNNAALFKKASEFVEVAENEIYKSAELQHSISTSLQNLLAIKKFKPLIKYFSVGNWIRVRIDDQIYKLRLLEYSINFGSFDTISVVFSDVIKVKTGITDIQSVLSQASSIATSYSSVQKQASQGEQVKGTVDQWLSAGLNSAQVRIQSNNTEDIVLDKNGLLCRSYNELTDTYDPEQFRITHNIMAYTKDNWNTVSTAFGKHDYIVYDKNKLNNDGTKGGFVDKTGYGLSAEFVTTGYVTGSQIIGGEIYSDNYSVADATGSYLNLRDGTFSFGGGTLSFDGTRLWLSSPDIPTNESIENIATEITGDYLRTAEVYAEKLLVNSANIQGKLTANQINVSDVITVGGIAEIGDIPTKVSELSNDSGYETATSIKNTVITQDYIETLNIRAGSVAAENITGTTISGKTISGGSITIGNNFSVDANGILAASGGKFTGEISSTNGDIGGFIIGESSLVSEKNTIELNSNGYFSLIGGATTSVLENKTLYPLFNAASGILTLGLRYENTLGTYESDLPFIRLDYHGVYFYDYPDSDESRVPWLSINTSGRKISLYDGVLTGYEINLDDGILTTKDIRSDSNIYLKCGGTTSDEAGRTLVWNYVVDSQNVYLRAGRDNIANVGSPSFRWDNIYATNGTIETSDKNQKQDIQKIEDKYLEMFDLLEPVSFKRIDGDRTHIGFVSQDVESAMNQVGLNAMDFAGFCKDVKEAANENGELSIVSDENGSPVEIYGLRYSEFIALNTAKIKQLEQLVLQLKDEINELKSK